MSIKHLFYAIAASGILLGAASCSDNEPGTGADPVDFTLKLNMPISLTDPQLSSVDVAFTGSDGRCCPRHRIRVGGKRRL